MSSENSLSFFGAGGHSHDGSNSTLIDVRRYSLFDFSLGYKGTQTRINAQSTNQQAFEEYVVRIVNSKVLQPAGIDLAPDTLNGKAIRANTITATEIKAGTITANELTSNVVLVNNIIRSSTFNGSFDNDGNISNAGTSGWAISYSGASVFNNATIRGSVNSSTISASSIAGGTIDIGGFDSSSFHVDANGNMWLGGSTYADAPFRVSAGGVLRSRGVYVSNSSFTTTITNATFLSQYYDAPVNAYASYAIGPTQLTHTGYWPGSNSTAESAVREKTIYFTNGVFFDGRAAEGGTYSSVGDFYTGRSGGNVHTVLDVITKNNSGTTLQYVQLFDGYVISSRGKAFKMDHPLYPGKQLLHAAIEGPSLDVFYRGTFELVNGEAEIELPDYFEALTKTENRTVNLTAEVADSSEPVAQLAYSQVNNGKFKVFEVNGPVNPSQKFTWLVMATRSDSEFEAVVDNSAFPSPDQRPPMPGL